MKTQEYLKEFGLQKLIDELKIKIRDYPDRIIFNYNQIESPRFNEICDECRALILRKDENWSVMSQAFIRFLNIGEDKRTNEFPIMSSKTRIESKIDGSLISLYWDNFNLKWQAASRSCAFAEGQTALGNTFADVFYRATKNTNIVKWLESNEQNKNMTWIFELCSPETRIVTPFSEYKVFLTGARDNTIGQELNGESLDKIAIEMKVERPERFAFSSLEQAIEKANSLPSMQEGFVLVYEEGVSYWRLKCKNSKYLSIANMRHNGVISAHRILYLIVLNDHEEYLQYFESDRPYFIFVKDKWEESLNRIIETFAANKNLEYQKDYALSIIPKTKYDFEKGFLFEMRKGKTLTEIIKALGINDTKRLTKGMNLRDAIAKRFGVVLEEE